MIYEILGDPKPKQSVKFSKSGFAYQPKDKVNYIVSAKWQLKQQLPKGYEILDEPLMLFFQFIFPPLKAHKTKKFQYMLDNNIPILKTSKPDVMDNLPKPVADAMSGLVYRDDSVVVLSGGIKYYGKEAKTIIHISPVNSELLPQIAWDFFSIIQHGV